MPTLIITIVKSRVLADGRHVIRVALRHQHKTCYIPTRFVVENGQFRNGQVVQRPDANLVNRKLRAILDEYQSRLDGIENAGVYSCAQLKRNITTTAPCSVYTFQVVSDSYTKEMSDTFSDGYKEILCRSQRYFTEFAGPDYLIEDVNADFIAGYDRFLSKRGLSASSVALAMRVLKTIIKYAERKGFAQWAISPFASYKIQAAPARECDISVEELRRIIDYQPKKYKHRLAKDLFLLSFYLGGMNLADILAADFSKNTVEYERQKTAQKRLAVRKIVIPVIPQAREILDRWTVKGQIKTIYKFSYNNMRGYITRSLKAVGSDVGIDRIMFYSARKTFAQLAMELGVPDSVVDYCLGHSDSSRGVIRYYNKVRTRQAQIALTRVADYVADPQKYEDYINMRMDIMAMGR